MCAQITTANEIQLESNGTAPLSKQESSYKGRRGRLCGTNSAKPWRIQGGPSIYGGLGGTLQR